LPLGVRAAAGIHPSCASRWEQSPPIWRVGSRLRHFVRLGPVAFRQAAASNGTGSPPPLVCVRAGALPLLRHDLHLGDDVTTMFFHPNQIKRMQARGASAMLRARVSNRHSQTRRSRALHGGGQAQPGHGRETSGADQSSVFGSGRADHLPR
jgi:hypothetical protein